MTLRASIELELWSPTQILIWIATRSLVFVSEMREATPSEADERIWRQRHENGAPYGLTLSAALLNFRRGSLRLGIAPPSRRPFEAAREGVSISDLFDFASADISLSPADAMRTWPDWPAVGAWKAAQAAPWRAPTGLSRSWIKSLPMVEYLPFEDVVDLLAFGPSKAAIGLSELQKKTGRLCAALAIVTAASQDALELIGSPCERRKDAPHLLRRTGPLSVIEFRAISALAPAPDGARDWLGPRRYADEFSEVGHAPESISFCEAKVDRSLLVKWMAAAASKAPSLKETEVRALIDGEKESSPFAGIEHMVKLVQSSDPLFPREEIRAIARKEGVVGRRGRPKNNSAD